MDSERRKMVNTMCAYACVCACVRAKVCVCVWWVGAHAHPIPQFNQQTILLL